MKGVTNTGLRAGLPATAVLRLASDRPASERQMGNSEADEVILAGVTYPPRIGEARPIAALMPHVLARYGLAEVDRDTSGEHVAIDVLA